MYYLINIGSNLGDRRLNLSRAMAAVMRYWGNIEMSHVVETEPFGFASEHKFLNVGIMFSSGEDPHEVLRLLQEIERSISPDSHRRSDGSYADRLIDIDIVAIDDKVIDDPDLKVPHPHLAERDFFLVPLEEIAPAWHHPLTGLTPTKMIEALPHNTARRTTAAEEGA